MSEQQDQFMYELRMFLNGLLKKVIIGVLTFIVLGIGTMVAFYFTSKAKDKAHDKGLAKLEMYCESTNKAIFNLYNIKRDKTESIDEFKEVKRLIENTNLKIDRLSYRIKNN